jgi:hypothetical protein
MKTRLEGNRLIIRDQPFGFWLFYSFFIAGGLMALVLSLSAAPDWTTTIIGSVIGLGNITGGLYMVKREPASIVEIDKASDEVRACRWSPIGKRQKTYPVSAIRPKSTAKPLSERSRVSYTSHRPAEYKYRRLAAAELPPPRPQSI